MTDDEREPESLTRLREDFDARSPAKMREMANHLKAAEERYRKMAAGPSPEEIAAKKSKAGALSKGKRGSKKPEARIVTVNLELLKKERGSRSVAQMAQSLKQKSTTLVNIFKTGRTSYARAVAIAARLRVNVDSLLT